VNVKRTSYIILIILSEIANFRSANKMNNKNAYFVENEIK